MADKTQNVKTRLSFDGEAEYKAACKEINSTLKVLNSEMKLVTAEYKDNASSVDALKAKQAVLQKAQALELRRCMLKIFNPELSATLVYEYGGFKRVIDCRAYGEPKILKKEVLYEFDLQIECLNPFWREEEETKEDIASWVAAWHFPCVIEKDSTKSMIYGYRAESVIVDCYNEGDVSTGMRIRFTALGTVSNPILLNVDTEEFIQINATMKTGDVIEINTKYGSKGAKLIRDGVETDYFRYIDVDSTFMQLAIGDNMFRYDAASGVNSLEVSIFYSKEFLGV